MRELPPVHNRHGWRFNPPILPSFRTEYDIAEDQFFRGWHWLHLSLALYRRGWEKRTHGVGLEVNWGWQRTPSARVWLNAANGYRDETEHA